MCLLHPFSTKKLFVFFQIVSTCIYRSQIKKLTVGYQHPSDKHIHTPRLPTIIIFKQVFIPLIVPRGTFTAVKAII